MKKFIITVDTEGDDLWTKKITKAGLKKIETTNAQNLERFQLLCEKYGFVPTWLVNYEMSQSEVFQQLGRSVCKENKAEIGMHMHAWNNPPIEHLPYNPRGTHTYIGEYPKKIQWEKMKYLACTLEDIFQVPVTSFRSGRWYLDEFTLKCLKKLGFMADCTVTPGISWGEYIGNHLYGTDYSKDKLKGCYQLSDRNIHKAGASGIYEVPPTILRRMRFTAFHVEVKYEWLRPNGKNLKEMLWIVDKVSRNPQIDYIEFMIHSSELSAGANPIFKSKMSIERLYEDLEVLFAEVSKKYVGVSLSDYVRGVI